MSLFFRSLLLQISEKESFERFDKTLKRKKIQKTTE